MNPWRGLGNLPREVWVLSAATLINRAGTMALPFLALYLTRSLGLAPSRAGLALTVYGVGALVTAPLAGRLSDRVGAARIMKASLIVSGLILLTFPLARGFTTILAVTLIWAIASEAFRPASMAIIADLVMPEQRKAAFALSRLAINLGMSVGPAAGGLLAAVSFSALFFVDGVTSILAGIVLLVSPWRTRPPALETNSGEVLSTKRQSILADHRFLYFLTAMIPAEVVFFQHLAAMPLFLVRDLRMSEAAFGLMSTVNTLLIIFLEVPLNRATAHWSHSRSMALGAFLCGAGFGAMALADDFLSTAATVVVWTFGEMILLPASAAYVADIAPAQRQGEYMGFYTMSFSVAFIIAPLVGTAVLDRFGAPVLWGVAFITGCLSAAMMLKTGNREQGTGVRGE